MKTRTAVVVLQGDGGSVGSCPPPGRGQVGGGEVPGHCGRGGACTGGESTARGREGGRMSWGGGKLIGNFGEVGEGAFKIAPGKSPRQIDMINGSQTDQGIYQFRKASSSSAPPRRGRRGRPSSSPP